MIRQLKCRPKMITQPFQESSCKHLKQLCLWKKIWPLFGLPLWGLMGKYYYLAYHNKVEHFVLDSGINRCVDILVHFDANLVSDLMFSE